MVIAETENNSNENLSRRKFPDKEKFCCGASEKVQAASENARRRLRGDDEEPLMRKAANMLSMIQTLFSSRPKTETKNHNPMREDCRLLS